MCVDVSYNLVYDQSPNTTSYYKGDHATSLKYATSGHWVTFGWVRAMKMYDGNGIEFPCSMYALV
jgi:hypothetical protein